MQVEQVHPRPLRADGDVEREFALPLISRRGAATFPVGTEHGQMAPTTNDTEDRVRRRALELWEQHGSPEGYEEEFWLQAERELKCEGDDKGTSANAKAARSGSGSDGPH